jgi:Domain of unknown function (DUF4276)
MMKELVFFLEEPSAKAMLQGVLPKIFPDNNVVITYITFDGKQDLEKQLFRKLRDYQNSLAKFIVLRDQDSYPDCKVLKANLLNICAATGKANVLVRIACRELETYYLADLAAVESGLQITGLVKSQEKKKFRSPDYLGSPSKELTVLTKGRYQKVGGSRSIGPHLDIENIRSDSFKNLVSGIKKIIVD